MCVCAATYSLLSKNHWTNIYHRACLLKNLCIQFVSIHSTVLCTAIGGKHTKIKQNKRRVSTRRQAANSHSELSAVNANPQFPMNNINLLLFNTLSCFSVFLYPFFIPLLRFRLHKHYNPSSCTLKKNHKNVRFIAGMGWGANERKNQSNLNSIWLWNENSKPLFMINCIKCK